jgi:hypothetical protein
VNVAPLTDESSGTRAPTPEQNKNRLVVEAPDNLRARKVVDGRDWIEFAVADTGIGMMAEQQARKGRRSKALDRNGEHISDALTPGVLDHAVARKSASGQVL